LIAQLCVVHAAGGGSRVLERRALVIAELCEVVDRGRAFDSNTAGVRRTPAPVMAEGVVGAVMAVLYARLHAQGASAADGYADRATQQPQPLIELHGELMSVIVLPYLGSKVAGNELRRAVPAPRPQVASIVPELAQSLPSEGSGSRLTYRTIRVLMSIAELPGGSNREVAERVGIVDQGQISKLLTRLEYQGLIVNRGAGSPARGTPNAWWLTEDGEALERELRERPSNGEASVEGATEKRKGTRARE
jgi:DNA-binding MarR family transcriptional regulator